ncbi:hypothetical protein Tco_1453909, partial [Tanacetum coccineum]
GRSLDISYFHMFGCPMFIHNQRDHLGKFNENADDGFFLGYSPVAKSFRVFIIRRQEMEETYHVTFNEANDVVTKINILGDEINFNEYISFLDDEFLVPRINPSQSSTMMITYLMSLCKTISSHTIHTKIMKNQREKGFRERKRWREMEGFHIEENENQHPPNMLGG